MEKENLTNNNHTSNDSLDKKIERIACAGIICLAGISAFNLYSYTKPTHEKENQEVKTIVNSMKSPNYTMDIQEKTYENIVELAKKVWEQRTTIYNPTEEQIKKLREMNIPFYTSTSLMGENQKITIPFDENMPITAQYEKFIEKNSSNGQTYYELCYKIPTFYSMYNLDKSKPLPNMVGYEEDPSSKYYVLYSNIPNQDIDSINIDTAGAYNTSIPVYLPYKYLLELKDEILLSDETTKLQQATIDNPYLFAIPKGYVFYSANGKKVDAHKVDEKDNLDIFMIMDVDDTDNIYAVKSEYYDTLKIIDKLEEVIRDEYYAKTNSINR